MPNVLIVDDSPIDRVLIEGVLKKDPRIKTRLAQSGSDALAILGQWQPDIVVTDLQMPEMDGLQLVTAIRIHYPQRAGGADHGPRQRGAGGAGAWSRGRRRTCPSRSWPTACSAWSIRSSSWPATTAAMKR